MPHLSPMTWPLTTLILFIFTASLLAQSWWQPQPHFPSTLSSLSPTPMPLWPWA